MWKLLTLITSILENPKIALRIIKLLEKYGNSKIKAILQSIKDIEHQLAQIQYYLNMDHIHIQKYIFKFDKQWNQQ
ncbi:hypothetical protein C6B38_00905 [Spiroplasma sp. ChiS]|uniref:hypothetical protein n=1 Tax=Spiroplasma sp. ChiS TaxID=2099885 RepID=UPI000CF987E2|nr:hypothetical protein [Spiroplasma sp. ChiS]PQP79537.1 hypothetical protein C6B38_00905 [Spiroplasma sp. ChiS]